MLETELFALLEHTSDAAYSVSLTGQIRSWNAAATRLFGYSADEAMAQNVDELLQARDTLGTPPFAGGEEAAARRWDDATGSMPNFDLRVRTRDNRWIWVNVSTIIFENHRTGERIFVRLVRDIDQRYRNQDRTQAIIEAARQLVALADDAPQHAPVEALSEQERRILRFFARGRNAASIARELKISTQTLRNHLHHINRKLRTHNRLEAVTHAQQRGLLD